DAASVLDIERRLANDPALRAEHDRLAQLRKAMSAQLKSERASDDFLKRIAAIAENPNDEKPADNGGQFPVRMGRSNEWVRMAAAAVLAAAVTAGGMYGFLRPNSEVNEIASIVADHQRALLSAAPFDVASSDRHTVKPWFDSKLALSPQVIDLAD